MDITNKNSRLGWMILPLFSLGITSQVMAVPGNATNVKSWCANAGRSDTVVASKVACDGCHSNKPAYLSLQSDTANETLLSYFCPETTTITATTNQPPTVHVSQNSLSVAEGVATSFIANPSDPDSGDTVTLSINSLPDGATFSASSGLFQWTPATGSAGTYPVTITATDSTGAAATTTVTIIVAAENTVEGNTPPVIMIPSTESVVSGKSLQFTVIAQDGDGDNVTLTARNLPEGATFTVDEQPNESGQWTGQFSWTPTAALSAPLTVTFTATDDFSIPASYSGTVNIYVTSAPVVSGGGTVKSILFGKALWNNRQNKLSLAGVAKPTQQAGGLTVTLTDAVTGSSLGTSTINQKGRWTFTSTDLTASPCLIQATIGDVAVIRPVDRAPSSCFSAIHGDDHHQDHHGFFDDHHDHH